MSKISMSVSLISIARFLIFAVQNRKQINFALLVYAMKEMDWKEFLISNLVYCGFSILGNVQNI